MKLLPVSLAVLTLLSSFDQLAHAGELRRSYIVRLADKPVASYAGGISGMRATQPGAGMLIDLNSTDVKIYSAYLGQKQAAVRALVANAPVSHEYKVVFNGFSAKLTDAEVRQLKASGNVASVVPNTVRHMVTNYTPTFLGLDQPNGLWNQLGGKERAGEGIVIGVVDGGVWPESPSYADRVDSQGAPTFDAGGTLAYGAPPASWKGQCQTGEGFAQQHCNNKLIGAQYFDADFQSEVGALHWSDFRSPRDSLGGTVGHGGHGTHTSSTAAGNNNVPATVSGVAMGGISGIAPRARVAAYKVCWSYDDSSDATGAGNGCWVGDSVAAIEKAVTDGVNVINFSISGGETVDDPVAQAFLHASNAGVVVAAAAGNAGPAESVNHIGPWVATVAASTHDRQLAATLTLASGNKYSGASMNVNALPTTAMIRAEDAGVAGADLDATRLCTSAASNNGVALLDPAKVAGKIVVCTRGVIARVEKSEAVKQAGGVGMVLVDDGLGPVADIHSVPSVHVSAADGALILAYAQSEGAAGAISKFATVRGAVPAPMVAGFSSRGPNRLYPDVLKPDMAAPGVDILAAVTPELTVDKKNGIVNGTFVPPSSWAFFQGTSMAAPHVAGLAALLRQQHPLWSPAAIKSALMTSGADTVPDTLSGNAAGILPWGQGAGHVTPNLASDPGLVYDATATDYRKYLCGVGMSDECGSGTMPAYNLNLASITVNNVLGTQSVTRTVTNVGSAAATYTANASISGYDVVVAPSTLVLNPGESKSFTVTLTRTDAADDTWQYGHLVWSDGSHTVRSPLSARSGRPLVAPLLVTADRASGMKLLSVTTGFTGKMTAMLGGMKEVSRTSLSVAQAAPGTADTIEQAVASCKAGAAGVRVVPVTIPINTIAARFETFDRDTDGGANGAQDVDLLVLSGDTLLDYSMHVGANEALTLASPPAGVVQVCVIGFDLAQGSPANLALSSSIVNRSDVGGNLKAALPSKVYGGSNATVGLSWSGLAAGKRYVGGLQMFDPNGTLVGTTVISIDTDNAIPVAAGVTRTVKRNSAL